MKVLIIGVNGFIANYLAKFLNERGITVYGTSSKILKNPYCLDTYELSFENQLLEIEINFDWIIHMSYLKDHSINDNVDFTITMAERFKKNGVKKQIFFSSISSISNNNSDYALIKRETEKWFISNNLYIIRPGLVIGYGGLFKQMCKKVKLFPLIPLVDEGNSSIKFIGLDDLLSETYKLIINPIETREINLFYKNFINLKTLIKEIARFYKKRLFFINIPFDFILNIVKFFERLGINVGITSQNILGLKLNEVEIKSNLTYEKDFLLVLKENVSK